MVETIPTPRADLIALGHRFADVLNDRDVPGLHALLAAGYRNHNPYVEDGPDACVAFFEHFLQAVPDLRVTAKSVICDEAEGTVIGRYTYEGTHEGAFMGAPATGNRVAMRSIDLWRVENGRFVEHWDELNTLDLFMQIGAARMVTSEAA